MLSVAVAALAFGEDGRVSCVLLLPHLGAQDDLELSDARELAEYAPADAFGGDLILADGEAPKWGLQVVPRALKHELLHAPL